MEKATFQQIYEAHAGDVLRFARYLTGDASRAEEIVSETFLRAWASRSRIQTETAKAYLLAIARNLCIDAKRRERPSVPLTDEHAVAGPGAESRLELERVFRAMEQLPEGQREALVLTAVHGLSYEEAARVLEVSLSLLKVRIHRARLRLAGSQESEP